MHPGTIKHQARPWSYIASILALFLLVSSFLAVSPALHRALHTHKCTPADLCAVSLLTSHQVVPADPGPPPHVAPAPAPCKPCREPQTFPQLPRQKAAPDRGPPSLDFAPTGG